jgi:uncharacterized protein
MKVIDGVLAVEISPDEFEARARLLQCDEPPECRLIVDALQDAGVRFGILQEAVLQLRVSTGDAVIVAKGVRPGRGEDGWVEYLFSPPPDGTTDRNPLLHPIVRNTSSGQPIAILHPPSEGTPGTTVTGRIVPGKPGRRATFEMGSNVTRDRNDLSRVLAKVDGNIVPLPTGGLSVHPVLPIAGDLDLSVGDIDFIGTVKVEGDVKGGVTVRAGKHLHIFGGVEDAIIECGGDVVVEKGFIGHGQGRIYARGDVRVHHIRNQLVRSEGSVFIGVESIDARIEAGGKVTGITAALIGGSVDAGGDVEVKIVGSSENSRVCIHAGRRAGILMHLAEIDKEHRNLEGLLRGLRKNLYAYNLTRIRGPLDPDQLAALKELQNSVGSADNRLNTLQHERHALMQELQHACDPRVIVHHVIHENVSIDINGARMVTDTPMTQVVFVKEKHRIVPLDLEWRVSDTHENR